ncbi:hypothetical protein D0Z07_9345 [Hyphodiscus hymeniophilus]|uniref:FAD-binding FR-type domain-containing protein n=1 Tax=Hyphodiscus hymeniophilus TaxID=353542 RepID=A0A9P6SJM8_9HELO|nr:hypothetical protein D0Z07_9345 [Hyphodiscus hymeniophilus]
MDNSLIYAIVMGGSFCLLLLINCLPLLLRFVKYLFPLLLKYLIYRYSLADVLIQLIYIARNDITISQAGLRAGTLAIINLIPLFVVPYLSTLADLLALFPFKSAPEQVRSYTILTAYTIWRHLPSEKGFPRVYIYISAGLFLLIYIYQGYMIIRRNGIFHYRSAQAHITHEYSAVRVRVQLHKPLDVKAGQIINLWMWIPSVSFWSFLQSHPFVVISWAERAQDHLDLFIEPRRGLTRDLLRYAEGERAMHPWVLFSGPHGKSIPTIDCENILMIASGFGIAAHLPYLKQLIHGYNAREVRARRIHLVWQVRDISVILAAQSLLNGALNEDTLDDGWILAISIYCESSDIGDKSFGKRANVRPGKAPLREILQAEVAGKHIEKKLVDNIDWDTKRLVEGELESGGQARRAGQLLVTVSATDDIRDELRSAVRGHLTDGVSFFELDFQPSH